MFVDLDWPLNASSLLSASAELLVLTRWTRNAAVADKPRDAFVKCSGVADLLKSPHLRMYYNAEFGCSRSNRVRRTRKIWPTRATPPRDGGRSWPPKNKPFPRIVTTPRQIWSFFFEECIRR